MPTAPYPVKVTVLMTLYNKGAFVADAVRSILANTFTDFELLVVDDASTDGGLDVVKAIVDPRIRILESAVNTGRAAAANRGYDAAIGEYVAVLDADDVAMPERLAKQVAFMDSHPDVGVVGGWLQAFGDRDKRLLLPASHEEAASLSIFGVPVYYSAAMFRKSVLDVHHVRCNPDWRHPGMDHLFLLAAGRHAHYANLQEVLTLYRTGAQNMRHGRDAYRDSAVLSKAILQFAGIPATEAEVALHLMLLTQVVVVPNVRETLALFRWKNKLLRIGRSLFPGPSFPQQVEHRWDRAYHRQVQTDAWTSFLHITLSGQWRKYADYWAKVSYDRWRGRKPASNADGKDM